MTELTYTVPTVGEKVTVAEPLVDTALTEVKTVVNGKVGTVNIETNKALVQTNNSYAAAATITEAKEEEGSSTRMALVVLQFLGNAAGASTAVVFISGVELTGQTLASGAAQQAAVSFLLPPTVKWKWEKGAAGEKPTVKARTLLL